MRSASNGMNNKKVLFAVLLFGALNIFIWGQVFPRGDANDAVMYFLDVGQGDSSLIELSGGMQMIIDAGPDDSVVRRLESILPLSDRYIDVAVMTHPQADHAVGFIDMLKRYRIGVLVINGDSGNTKAHAALAEAVSKTKTKVLMLGRGDRIRYRDNIFSVLWPPPGDAPKDLNDRAMVIKMITPQFSALFAADIPAEVERQLLGDDINSDILKVPHHGSRFSSSKEFLKKVSPSVSVIQVGKNSYGHPTKETLARLAEAGTRIFRNDMNGTVKVYRRINSLVVSGMEK